ncbi:serine/arginine-rich splicing factor 11-like isoform X2 [Oncorhynchus nerka]|uniref:RRM domain-containing protein n=1 Tax=Oncorhynchus tshawytscha TaxID=74940 RepID=A0A8C8MA52_ONCTS|nr:serine/arginine-rich splicing factor 11 isoform X2 [Oncorhynchus tshawytscha]XP_029479343.1 serine/arginine-rich splicing factor 11-like isoform X2 [Oncorhynchus nerka]
MNCTTNVVQVTNVSPSTTSEQMRMLFGFLGTIEELKLFPPDESPLPVTSRVCFVKFKESESVGVSQHLTNTVFVDRALIVVPFAEGVIPEEAKALSLLAPANAVAGILPGGGLLPTPNPMSNPQMGGNPFGGPSLEAMAAFGFPNPNMNMNPQSFPTDQLLKFMSQVDPKMNHMGVGMNMNINMNPGLKADSSNKEIEEAMKRVREAQSLISAAIEPGNKESKRKHSRSRSRSRRRRSRSRSRHRRSKSRSRRRSHSRNRRRSKSPRRRSGRSHSKDRSRPSPSKSRDRKKEERDKKRSKTPPKSYSTARRSRSIDRKRRRTRSASRSPKKSPKRKVSRTPSPRRHKKEKKRDKEREKDRERRSDKDRSRDERKEKKERSKDKEKEREKTDGEKGDVKTSLQVTRDYDEEEQGYDSEKERERLDKKDSDQDSGAQSPHSVEGNGTGLSKVNGDDHREEDDMDVSD